MADPILVLQLQRLGDLVLTFPLLEELNRRHPDNPLLVVAEKNFYSGLERLSPPAMYFPAEKIGELKGARFEMALNLSHRPEAAECLNNVHAPLKLGKITGKGVHINGFWQLYRANLTQNNRHNTFHWSDLNLMDLPELKPSAAGLPGAARPLQSRRIGLVIGASDSCKTPDVKFWAQLATLLARKGFMPFFLGGTAEKEAGIEAAGLSGLFGANLCGRLSLQELAEVMKGMALCITPDTGPMHLASWLGVPTLNLSMGPVHAHETGPALPGQWVLRSTASCVGCWQCGRGEYFCKKAFLPHSVSKISTALLNGVESEKQAGLELLKMRRDEDGFLRLLPQKQDISARWRLENFWRKAFLAFDDERHLPAARLAAGEIMDDYHELAKKMRQNLAKMLSQTLKTLRSSNPPLQALQTQPLHSRIFAGHCQLWLENENFSQKALGEILKRQETLLDILSE